MAPTCLGVLPLKTTTEEDEIALRIHLLPMRFFWSEIPGMGSRELQGNMRYLSDLVSECSHCKFLTVRAERVHRMLHTVIHVVAS